MSDPQLVELEEHARQKQGNAPETVFAAGKVGDACNDQNQRPKLPDSTGIDNPYVIQEEDGANGDNHQTPKDASAVGAFAEVNAHDDRAAASSLCLIIHRRSPLASEPVLVEYPEKGIPNTSCSSRAPRSTGTSGQHDTKICRTADTNCACSNA